MYELRLTDLGQPPNFDELLRLRARPGLQIQLPEGPRPGTQLRMEDGPSGQFRMQRMDPETGLRVAEQGFL